MAQRVVHVSRRSQERIDARKWKSLAPKARGDDRIPALGNSTHCCSCKYCRAILKETQCWTQTQKEDLNVDIKIGDRVLIQELLPGVVKYIGDLDSNYTNSGVYVGVKLDDPVGDHDGVFNNKRYFECPHMHGVIVPIEDVNLLVPTDGRSIKPNRFFSMPSYNLDSLTSLGSEYSDRDVTPRTMSESRFSTPLPEYPSASNNGLRPQSGKKCRPQTAKKKCNRPQSAKKKCGRKLCHEDGVTRSGVFICDAPGSIAAEIRGGLDPHIKEKLLANLSLDKDSDIAGSSLLDNSLSAINVPPTPPSSPVRDYIAQPTGTLHSKKPIARFVIRGSDSVATNLKKPYDPLISKLVTNKVAAMPDKKEPYMTEPAETATCNSEDSLARVEAPMMHRLRRSLPPDEQLVANEKPLHTATFTGLLLSGLPYHDAITPPPSGSACQSDVEFQEWVDKWGGGLTGWTKAHTLQKLRDAQRKGQKELEWEMKVDQLEKNNLYTPKVKIIQVLRDEIVKARDRYKSTHLQLEQCKANLTHSELSKQIHQLEDETKRLREMNECLLGKVLDHPLFDVVREAVEYLGLEIDLEGLGERLHEQEEGQEEEELEGEGQEGAEGAEEVLAQPV